MPKNGDMHMYSDATFRFDDYLIIERGDDIIAVYPGFVAVRIVDPKTSTK